MPRGTFQFHELMVIPARIIHVSWRKLLGRLFLHVSCLWREGSLIFLYLKRRTHDVDIPRRIMLLYAPRGSSSLISLEEDSCATLSPYCIILLSRCYPSRCYLPCKARLLLTKCVAFSCEVFRLAHFSYDLASCSLWWSTSGASHWSVIPYNPPFSKF